MYLYGNVGSEWVDDQWASSRHLFWLFFVEIVEDIVEDQVIAVLVFSLKESNIQ